MQNPTQNASGLSVAEAYLAALKRYGIDYLYVGAGTDTAPIIEAYARASSSGLAFPEPIVAVHENLALSMAHGYFLATGRPQAIMLHVSVGTANAVCALMNATRAQVPLLFTAGRTPLFEEGALGARNNDIHWGQEMFDQGSMVRELVKWDYELRDGMNVDQVVGRAYSVSMTEPKGPVYLSLPREVLARPMPDVPARPVIPAASAPFPDPAAVSQLARKLMQAEMPMIVCTSSGLDTETVPLLVELADRYGVGVAENKPKYLNFPTTHPLHMGFSLERLFPETDALLFLECDVPWLPSVGAPRDDAFVAHAGSDPLYANYPVRSFRSDLTVTSTARALLRALAAELESIGAAGTAAARRERLAARAGKIRDAVLSRRQADEQAGGAINKAFFSRCLDEVLPADAIIVNEYPAQREHMSIDRPGSFFNLPSSGGLGWGLPAALGVKQARPDALVVSTVGDGAYIFANPSACHQASAMHRLPLLTVIYNNQRWEAVERAALALYPDTEAARHVKEFGNAPLSSLQPVPAFEKYVEASGGYGERVEKRADLVPALRRALRVVQEEGREAVVNVLAV